jgi:hypothetical protein
MMYYDDLLKKMIDGKTNMLILGPGGSGKSILIRKLKKSKRPCDIITVAPSGIASKNIEGNTIQSFFGITPNTYTIEEKKIRINNPEKIMLIRSTEILLIDEISMLRCEILDIVDSELRNIRRTNKPFGGLRLLFFGDTCQMEPVVQEYERNILSFHYPHAEGDYGFYNARVMRENDYFTNSFEIYQLWHDFRHSNDPFFSDILSDIRMGHISPGQLNELNNRFYKIAFYDEGYQYLTITNAEAKTCNNYFINKISGPLFTSLACRNECAANDYLVDIQKIKSPFYDVLVIKKGMKIMFVKNDSFGHRWVNGTMGRVIKVTGSPNAVSSVIVGINRTDENGEDSVLIVAVEPESIELRAGFVNNAECKIEKVGEMRQFPFVPAYAITIDKSQGLTLDKVALVLGKKMRDNQIYVALSRVRALKDLRILGRELRSSDIHFSKAMKAFNEKISEKIIPVYYQTEKIVNITVNAPIYGTQIIKIA